MSKIKIHTACDFLIAGILLLASFLAPAAGALEKPMVSCIFLIAFAIYLFIRRPVPLGIASLLIVFCCRCWASASL